MKLFLVLNRISHSFAFITHEISWSTLEINFIFLYLTTWFVNCSLVFYNGREYECERAVH